MKKITLLPLLMLVLAACGSSSSATSVASTATSAPTSTTTSTPTSVVSSSQNVVDPLYNANFSSSFIYKDWANQATTLETYGSKLLLDSANGKNWMMSMGQLFNGENFFGWNANQGRAESSTALVRTRGYNSLLNPATTHFYSALEMLFSVENVTSVKFGYTSAYLANKPLMIVMQTQESGPWTIVKEGVSINTYVDNSTPQPTTYFEYVSSTVIPNAKFAFIQNYNSFADGSGRLKMVNVVVS
jgi:hypothetical protein